MLLPDINNLKIALIGIGYVGLPLAMEFANKKRCLRSNKKMIRKVIAFDIDKERINELNNGFDRTNEFTNEMLLRSKKVKFTSEINDIYTSDVFIITVPTPINRNNEPDLRFIKKASTDIGFVIKKRRQNSDEDQSKPIIIYESTVYPGATEEICIPLIESNSGQKLNQDFFCGYSPERINPGDKNRKISSIVKVTSGSNKESAEFIDNLYGSIIKAGTHSTSSIKIAEAAKVIENTQRDLNIALVNEFSIIFKHLNLDTLEILEAAKTKWNFLDFKPGLVGGHCIGVDPYYLTYKSEKVGYSPKIVLAGREINNFMPIWVTDLIFNEIKKSKINPNNCEVLILGATFKENCPDFRNSKTIEIYSILNSKKMNLTIVDPYLSLEIKNKFDCATQQIIPFNKKFSIIICTVGHDEFISMTIEQWRKLLKKNHIIFDLKGFVPSNLNPIRP